MDMNNGREIKRIIICPWWCKELKVDLFNQIYIDNMLRELGNGLIKEEYKHLWSKEHPTSGYCYIIAEIIYHYTYNDYTPYKFTYDNKSKSHWYLKDKNDNVVDMTYNQFIPFYDENGIFQHEKEEKAVFYEGVIYTPKGKISQRGYELAKYFGLV